MAETVYLLCALSSITCGVLLARGFSRTRQRLLLWSALGFAGLAINNILLVIDLIFVPDQDFSLARLAAALAGLTMMVLGFVAEAE